MKSIILSLKKDHNFNFFEVNIENDKSLFEEYKEKIPVLKVNNRIFAKFRIDEKKLIAKLSEK